MQNNEIKFRVIIVAVSLLLANSACAFDMGNMMNPSNSNLINTVSYRLLSKLRIGIIYIGQMGYRCGSVFHVCSSGAYNGKGVDNGFNKKHEC